MEPNQGISMGDTVPLMSSRTKERSDGSFVDDTRSPTKENDCTKIVTPDRVEACGNATTPVCKGATKQNSHSTIQSKEGVVSSASRVLQERVVDTSYGAENIKFLSAKTSTMAVVTTTKTRGNEENTTEPISNTTEQRIPKLNMEAAAPTFLSDESSISHTTSSHLASSFGSTNKDDSESSLSRDSKTVNVDTHEDDKVAAVQSGKSLSNMQKNETQGVVGPRVFRPNPTKQQLRATAPVFIPKNFQNASLSAHSTDTRQSRRAQKHRNYHDTLDIRSSREFQDAEPSRVIRLQSNLNPLAHGVVMPNLGSSSAEFQLFGCEMYHWSPSSGVEFRIPLFKSWESAKEQARAYLATSKEKTVSTSIATSQQKPPRPHPRRSELSTPRIHPARQRNDSKDAAQSRSFSVPRRIREAIGITAGQAISLRPGVSYHKGKKITMIDERRKVFVIDLLGKDTCERLQQVRRLSRLEEAFAITLAAFVVLTLLSHPTIIFQHRRCMIISNAYKSPATNPWAFDGSIPTRRWICRVMKLSP